MARIEVRAEAVARVRAAMDAAPRAAFLPANVRHLAGSNRPVMIGWEATNSQPSTVARMLHLLDVHPGDRVLDVGSGSGWTSAILSVLAGEAGVVRGVELVPELAEYARMHLDDAGFDVAIHQSDAGELGLPDAAPFDRILVSAEASALPQQLVDQLADGGRLVVPVRGTMTVVDRHGADVRVREDSGRYNFVPLR